MESLSEIKEIINSRDNFLIMGHIDPDADCIGSVFALKWALDRLEKKALVLLTDHPEKRYSFLDIDSADYRLFSELNVRELEWTKYNLIALDAGELERLGEGLQLIEGNFLINIDHHIDNSHYGEINYVNAEMAAAGEIVFELLGLLNQPANLKIANALATAIIADTGGLRYQNTSARVLRIIASLIEIGVDIYQINKVLFGSHSFAAIKLKGMVLSTLKLSSSGKVAWLKIDQAMLNRTRTDMKEASGLVNLARDIMGVEVGVAFYELDSSNVKVGFRSNHYCPVNEIAAHFDGGGHPRAAGCRLNKSMEESIELVLSKVEEYV